MPSSTELAEEVRRHGFELIGVAPVEPIGSGWFAPHARRFNEWLERGDHADMEWLRTRAQERVVPETLLPGVKTAIVLWMQHRTETPPRPKGQIGRVAAYAWGRDYHNVLRKSLRKLDRWLFAHFPDLKRYISVDTGAILERAFAERASVGWIGRSTMLIHPKLGTFGSLAVIFTNQAFEASREPHPFRCGTCYDCVEQCPTGALSSTGLDARLCISYWTIEHRGLIPRHIRPMLEDWLFGCDICQDVCPWNHRAPRAKSDLWRPHSDRAWPDLEDWIRTPSADLDARLLGSPLRRAKGQGLRRNAMIVAANMRVTSLVPALIDVLGSDEDQVLRATALWAAHCLGHPSVLEVGLRDSDPMVRGEAEALNALL